MGFKARKIFILLGNPVTESLGGRLADAYEKGAREAGHTVARLNVGEMRFDPLLHRGYRDIQALEPDLQRFQALVREADHFVIIYPNWWCTMPAELKGVFDRAWLPGFAFRFFKEGLLKTVGLWRPLMFGKSARVVVTCGTHPFLIRLVFGDFTNEIRNGILRFSGFRTRVTKLGPAENISVEKAKKWFAKMEKLGARAR